MSSTKVHNLTICPSDKLELYKSSILLLNNIRIGVKIPMKDNSSQVFLITHQKNEIKDKLGCIVRK